MTRRSSASSKFKERWFQLLLALIAAAATIIAAVIATRSPAPKVIDEIIQVDRLKNIEHTRIKDINWTAANRYPDLINYFEETNDNLFRHFADIKETWRRQHSSNAKPISYLQASYITGSAGIGKSTVISRLEFIKSSQLRIKLKEFFEHSNSDLFRFTTQKDLFFDTDPLKIFNNLPSVQDPRDLVEFEKYISEALDYFKWEKTNWPEILILDDLDEIHPDVAKKILYDLEKFLENNQQKDGFLHIIVTGRPEAFAEHLTTTEPDTRNKYISVYEIKPIQLLTKGDLRLRVNNFWNYEYKQNPSEKTINAFQDLVYKHSFLSDAIGNLYISARLIVNSSEGLIGTEMDIKQAIWDELIQRAHSKHDRPATNGSYYYNVLEDIAAKYIDEVQDDGFFRVGVDDFVSVYDNRFQEIGKLNVKATLDRSGLVYLKPVNKLHSKYSFEPFLLHRFLVENRNARISALNKRATR